MKLSALPLKDAMLVEFTPRIDERGSFSRVFCADTLPLKKPIVQVNHSITRQAGTIRGLRYQVAPALEAKIVRCLRGRTFDVIADLRAGSPTFLQVFSTELTPEKSIFVPEGFAHGFQTLVPDCEVMYMTTAAYNKDCERSIRYSDPRLGIHWPLPVAGISLHDAEIPFLSQHFEGIPV